MTDHVPPPAEWDELGTPAPDSLVDDRLQLHHAAQLLAAFGQTLVKPRDDDSHRSATWDPRRRLFLSDLAPGELRLALAPAPFSVRLLSQGQEAASMELRGRTLEEAYGWLEGTVGAILGKGEVEMGRPEFEIPDHPVGEGTVFSPGSAGMAELERWFHDAHLALEALRSVEPRATAVRCWPHHFDIATLVVIEESEDPMEMRTVGLGLSPGDEFYAEPYWYGNAWPRPKPDALPQLEGPGQWRTKGWVGVVFTGSHLVASGDGPAQAGTAALFLDSALRAGLEVLDG